VADPSRQEEVGDGPSVVALGGGHGLAAALQAIRRYAKDVTAVVSVADDGGSSGRLRRALDVPAPGDLRKCLVALSEDAVWATAFEHRFAGGELEGHALGNLLIVGWPRRWATSARRSRRPAGSSRPSDGCCRRPSTPWR